MGRFAGDEPFDITFGFDFRPRTQGKNNYYQGDEMKMKAASIDQGTYSWSSSHIHGWHKKRDRFTRIFIGINTALFLINANVAIWSVSVTHSVHSLAAAILNGAVAAGLYEVTK